MQREIVENIICYFILFFLAAKTKDEQRKSEWQNQSTRSSSTSLLDLALNIQPNTEHLRSCISSVSL